MIKWKIRIEGLPEIRRKLNALPSEAQNIVRDRSLALAEEMAALTRAAGAADTPQSALAAKTIQAKRDRFPVVSAGSRGTRKAKAVLLGSEFGMNRKSGWYRLVRYFGSRGRQFRPHQGASSYWFFKTADDEGPRIFKRYTEMLDAIADEWGRD